MNVGDTLLDMTSSPLKKQYMAVEVNTTAVLEQKKKVNINGAPILGFTMKSGE